MRYIGIDPSTKTGLCVLNETGEVVISREIVDKRSKDPERMYNIIEDTIEEIRFHDSQHETYVCIEQFGFASQRAILMGGYGWGIRMGLYREGIEYSEVAPAALKKFTGAKGNAKKDTIRLEVYKRWGFEHPSDNVVDAYVLAQIARAKHLHEGIPKFQADVLQKIG